jgi:pantoate--beta-alanine ligase
MIVIDDINSLQKSVQELKKQNKTIGFVPTMGALHDGHISLIKKAKEQNSVTIVSIFVNPTQFLEGEDFDKYPKKDKADKKILELCGVDILFLPNKNSIYEDDEVLIKAPKIKGFILEGYNRPGHFDGMLQIVLKLFNLTKPTHVYFGKKDAQQLLLIKQMVKNFYLDINIVECDIVRENDGLALSSRNIYLTSSERKKALLLSKSLKIAAKQIASGILDTTKLKEIMYKILNEDGILIEYIAITDKKLQPIQTVILKDTIILIAVKIGTTRLIDNIWI